MEEKACAFTDRNPVHIDLLQGSENFDEMSQQFVVSSSGFQLLLLGKDGGVKLRSSTASLEDIFSLIDTMPMRRREMRDDQCWSSPIFSNLGLCAFIFYFFDSSTFLHIDSMDYLAVRLPGILYTKRATPCLWKHALETGCSFLWDTDHKISLKMCLLSQVHPFAKSKPPSLRLFTEKLL